MTKFIATFEIEVAGDPLTDKTLKKSDEIGLACERAGDVFQEHISRELQRKMKTILNKYGMFDDPKVMESTLAFHDIWIAEARAMYDSLKVVKAD